MSTRRNADSNYRPTHLLVVEDDRGLVNLACVLSPRTRMLSLPQHGVAIQRHTVIDSYAAPAIFRSLAPRFRHAEIDAGFRPAWELSAWYATEYEAVLSAIGEYDLTTGARQSIQGIKVRDQVHVTGAGDGIVRGFSACGRIWVSIPRYAHAALDVMAPANLVEARA